MQQIERLVTWVVFSLGLLAPLLGVGLAVVPETGDVQQGTTGMRITAATFLLAASPALALPFSARAARLLLLSALACLAAAGLYTAFGGAVAASPNLQFKVAVVGFAILVVVRLVLLRRKKGAG